MATTNNSETPRPTLPKMLGSSVLALWIFGGTIYFHVHFSLVFYDANREQIDAALSSFLNLFQS